MQHLCHQIRQTEHHLKDSEHHLKHHLEHQQHQFELARNEYERLAKARGFYGKMPEAVANEMIRQLNKVSPAVQHEINRFQDEVNQARGHLNHFQHQLSASHQSKSKEEQNLAQIKENIRRDQEAQAVHFAQQEARQKAKEAAEVQSRKAEAGTLKQQQSAQRAAKEAQEKAYEATRLDADETTKIVKDLIVARSTGHNDFVPIIDNFSALALSSQDAQVKGSDSAVDSGQSLKPSPPPTEIKKVNTSFGSTQVMDLHKELQAAKKPARTRRQFMINMPISAGKIANSSWLTTARATRFASSAPWRK
ncbi:hypothetical protein ABK905_16075 [Acerihabitans sp. KWT182]|uniref:Uncharacterized protein n=1 Tax=Acerihabitans sp. KWT182 TaxID=3157919 RepID=A0AAU7Q7T3_9GAMM